MISNIMGDSVMCFGIRGVETEFQSLHFYRGSHTKVDYDPKEVI